MKWKIIIEVPTSQLVSEVGEIEKSLNDGMQAFMGDSEKLILMTDIPLELTGDKVVQSNLDIIVDKIELTMKNHIQVQK